MGDLGTILLAGLYYTLFLPIYTVFRCVVLVLSPVWHGIQFLLLPFFHLANFFSGALILPFRLLGRLETIYVYLGVAGIVGLVAGSTLYFFSSFIGSTLDLDAIDGPIGRTPAEYRAARRKRKAMQSYSSTSVPVGKFASTKEAGVLRQRDLLSQTILEEDTSDS